MIPTASRRRCSGGLGGGDCSSGARSRWRAGPVGGRAPQTPQARLRPCPPPPRGPMGRARALEVMLSAEDYDAELAERYGWIHRALPAHELGGFVSSLAHRIAGFPVAGQVAVNDRVNAIALAPAEDFRRDADCFGAGRARPRGARPDPSRAMQARLLDPRRGTDSGPAARGSVLTARRGAGRAAGRGPGASVAPGPRLRG
jgi:hypothetical protein